MKKISFFAVVAAAAAFTSCNNVNATFDNENVVTTEVLTENETIENDTIMVDSLAYEFGAANSDLKYIAQAQFGVDSAYLADFIEGMKKSALESKADSSELAYNKGVEFGRLVKATAERLGTLVLEGDSTQTVKVANMLQGILDGHSGNADVAAVQLALQKHMDAIESSRTFKTYRSNWEAGKQFLAENAKNDSVVTTASGLQYKVLVDGKGALPTDSTVVKAKYEGRLIDGTVFDSNIDKDKPLEVNMKYPSVIQGWVEALKLMPAGSKWEIYIPYQLAYGDRDSGKIKPFSTLIFTIEVLN